MVLVAGSLSFGTVHAGELSLTQEEKKNAIEFMKSSPEQVLAYEARFIEIAKDSTLKSASPKSEDRNDFKEVIVDSSTTVHIDYEKGVPVSFALIKTPKAGAYIEMMDGGFGQKMDGKIDLVQTADQGFVNFPITFVGVKNAKGESMTEVRCEDPSIAEYLKQADAYGMVYVNAQIKFQNLLSEAMQKVESVTHK